jgi:glycosyltransferase involved in cell wall biosynthesis
MRLLQIIQKPQLRGAEIFACQLSNHLIAMGHQVVIVALFPGDDRLPFKGEVLRLNRPLRKRFFDIEGWSKLRSIIKNFNPDIVQANAGDTLKFAALSKLFFCWRKAIVFRNANKISDFVNTPFKKILNSLFVRQLAHVISVSELCKIDFQSTFAFPQGKISCVPIGIDQADITSPLNEDTKHIYQQRPVLIHIGSFVKEKNHDGLLRIFKQVLSSYPKAQLVLVGAGPLMNKITEQAKASGISSNVHFLGSRNDALTLLTHADVLMLPSLIEGLPGVILESFYAGVPVVANNVGGVAEVVVANKTGCLVEKNNERAFAEAVQGILVNQDLKKKMVANARHMVLSEYDNAIIAGRFLETYRRILNRM